LGNSIEKFNHLYSQYVSTGVLSADTLNASNGLTVGTASSGLFSVLSNGNVGIGIDVPTTALNIRAESPTVLLQGTASTSQAGVRMVNDVNQAVYTWMSGSGSNWMSERAVMYAPALTFVADANQTGANGQSGAGNIWFLANDYRQFTSTPKMVINGNGTVGIGTTTPSAKLAITGSGNSTGKAFVVADNTNTQKFTIFDNGKVGIGTSSPLYLLHAGNVSTSGVVARFENSSGYCDINPTTTSLTCTSDIRLKKNIVTLDASTTLENLNKLNAVTYNWNTEDNASSTHAGFIAQEVQPLFPDLVATDESGLLSVSYSGFIPYLVQAVKTLTEMLGDMKEIFVSKLIKTDKLCINRTHGGEVCVTGDDIDAFMQSRTGSTQQPPQNETTAPTTDTGTTTERTSEGVVTSSTTPPSIQENITDTPQATSTTESVTPPVEESTQMTNTTQLE
jgi:hypothetical protein